LTDALVVLTTLPNAEAAAALAKAIVEERLAACGNVLPAVRSIYRWQGKTQDEPEVLVLFKTQRQHFERLRARIVELHPYEVPEVLALPVEQGHAPYLEWLLRETTFTVNARPR
jgi:periplasmic divalent cation tolerance protein